MHTSGRMNLYTTITRGQEKRSPLQNEENVRPEIVEDSLELSVRVRALRVVQDDLADYRKEL